MSLSIALAPQNFGTTTCEYSLACRRETDKLVLFPFGVVPVCDYHIEFMERMDS